MAKVGDIIAGRYRLLAQIGIGGMSTVFLAMDQTLNKQWTVKEISQPEDQAQRDLVILSLISEANLIKKFDHPAIPRIVDLVEDGQSLFVIRDYVEGENLEEKLRREGIQKEEDVCDWAIQLCDVLDYLHQRSPQVIYRDMKPANVMLRPNGTISLMDFGIAQEEGHSAKKIDKQNAFKTTTSTGGLGSRGFAAPEQYAGNRIAPYTDIYGLGATMYYLMTKHVASRNGEETVTPPHMYNPQITPEFEEIIMKALSHDPEDRYTDCAQMAYALQHYKEDNDKRIKTLKTKWYLFLASAATCVICALVGIGSWIGSVVLTNFNYDHLMQLARQATSNEEAEENYMRAAKVRPDETEPYLELVKRYRDDGNFSVEEEKHLQSLLEPNMTQLQKNKQKWAELSFEIGKLYWYYYNPTGNQQSATPSGNIGEYGRIRAAGQWMHNAAQIDEFPQHNLANIYDLIANFTTNIVSNINDGSDSGKYAPYFKNLQELLSANEHDTNDVVKLESANLVIDSLQTYARNFRFDGVTQADMQKLLQKAHAMAESVSPKTDVLQEKKNHATQAYGLASRSITDAFVDTEEVSG